MNKIKLLTILILGSVISCGDSMSMMGPLRLPAKHPDPVVSTQILSTLDRDLGALRRLVNAVMTGEDGA